MKINIKPGVVPMAMSYPANHEPRFSNFKIAGILDETLREGSERCMFSVSTDDKLKLVRNILRTGVKDVIFGSGPDDPSDMANVISKLVELDELADQKFSFILLLNCFEPLMKQFKNFPSDLKKHVTISFGMISHKSDERLFERTIERFREYGFTNFRVSLLNNFSGEIDEESYAKITAEIDRSRAMDIDVIRINDSLGTIYPEAMAILAANLRHDYPKTNFCLHAHNDRGFGLQNALNSIYHGFNLIEGGFDEFGNRSGLPAIELLNELFKEKNIEISTGNLDAKSVSVTAKLAEETFMVIPDLFRPLSGSIVDCENMGVTNIPDFLGSSSASRYFLNRIGLHKSTVEKVFQDIGLNDQDIITNSAIGFREYLLDEMRKTTARKSVQYEEICEAIEKFYDDDVLFSERVHDLAREYMKSLGPA